MKTRGALYRAREKPRPNGQKQQRKQGFTKLNEICLQKEREQLEWVVKF